MEVRAALWNRVLTGLEVIASQWNVSGLSGLSGLFGDIFIPSEWKEDFVSKLVLCTGSEGFALEFHSVHGNYSRNAGLEVSPALRGWNFVLVSSYPHNWPELF